LTHYKGETISAIARSLSTIKCSHLASK